MFESMLKIAGRSTVCLAVLGIASCSSAQPALQDASTMTMPAATADSVRSLLEETVAEHSVVGYSLGILEDGELTFQTWGGFANIEHQVPISEDSRYQIYSASKLFFNVALMQLVERGELDPEAILGTYLDDLPDSWAAITVRQAWSHMTGTTDILVLNAMEPTAEKALRSVIDIPLKFSPGTQTEYNQTNFLLLKMIFESITETDYRTYLEDKLLNPVGIADLPLGDLSVVAPNLTTNYEGHPHEVGKLGRRTVNFPPYVYTSAGVNISLGEFATWWQAVLEGQFVETDTLRTFWEPVLRADGSESHRSNGWERQHKDGILRIGHGGGARIHLFHYIPDADPERSVTVIFLNNGGPTYFNHRGLGDAVANIVLGAE